VEITPDELELILAALEDATVFRDSRSRVLDSAARRSARRYPARGVREGSRADADRRKSRQYMELAAKLRGPSAGRLKGPFTA